MAQDYNNKVLVKHKKEAQQAYMNQMQMGQGLTSMASRRDVAGLGSMGATQQAQAQAQLDATREANRLAAYEPYERLGYHGSRNCEHCIWRTMGQYQSSVTPNPTPLQTALGTGAVLSRNLWKHDGTVKEKTV